MFWHGEGKNQLCKLNESCEQTLRGASFQEISWFQEILHSFPVQKNSKN